MSYTKLLADSYHIERGGAERIIRMTVLFWVPRKLSEENIIIGIFIVLKPLLRSLYLIHQTFGLFDLYSLVLERIQIFHRQIPLSFLWNVLVFQFFHCEKDVVVHFTICATVSYGLIKFWYSVWVLIIWSFFWVWVIRKDFGGKI